MNGALGKRWVRGLSVWSASLLLSLSALSPVAAAPAKKAAKTASVKAAPAKAGATKAAKAAPAKATRSAAAKTKAAAGKPAVAKGRSGKADAVIAKASGKAGKASRERSPGRRALAEERSRGKTTRLAKGRQHAERVAARDTRLSLRPVLAQAVAAEPRAPRLSFGQVAGLHAADDPLDLKSSVALVLDQDTHEVLLSKNDHAVLPIASLTKLMTGLVVSEARLPLDEMVTITEEDVDTEKGSRSRLAIGTTLTRGELLHLALMSSENRAAHALGRSFPGGLQRFVGAMNARAVMLGMKDTRYVEPTGLSSANRSSAHDLATLVQAAAQDPLLRQLTTSTGYEVAVGNRVVQYNNTNRLVHSPDWQIGLQKTGYISEAGQCLVMQARVAGRKLIMVFLDSAGKYSRLADAERVRRWVEEQRPAATVASHQLAS